ncbi:MAG: hypothetical protein QXU73_01450 [Thermoplasmata archaeon]
MIQSEIAVRTNIRVESSVHSALKKLKEEGLVLSKVEMRGSRSLQLYYLNPDRWLEIMQIYFPGNRQSQMSIEQKAEFLESGFADKIFDFKFFSQLLARLWFKWAVDMNPNDINGIQDAINRRAWFYARKVPADRQSHVERELKAVREAIRLVQMLKGNDPHAKSSMESYIKQNSTNKGFLGLMALDERSASELMKLARLSPSLVGYLMAEDSHAHKLPLEFLLDVSPIRECEKLVVNEPDKSLKNRLARRISNELKKALFRFFAVMAIHDLFMLPESHAKALMKKAGLDSFQPHVKRIFNPNL